MAKGSTSVAQTGFTSNRAANSDPVARAMERLRAHHPLVIEGMSYYDRAPEPCESHRG